MTRALFAEYLPESMARFQEKMKAGGFDFSKMGKGKWGGQGGGDTAKKPEADPKLDSEAEQAFKRTKPRHTARARVTTNASVKKLPKQLQRTCSPQLRSVSATED